MLPQVFFLENGPWIFEVTWKDMPILPRVHAIFLFAIEYSAKAQPPQHTTTAARAPGVAPPPCTPLLLCAEEVEPWLTTQWQTEK